MKKLVSIFSFFAVMVAVMCIAEYPEELRGDMLAGTIDVQLEERVDNTDQMPFGVQPGFRAHLFVGELVGYPDRVVLVRNYFTGPDSDGDGSVCIGVSLGNWPYRKETFHWNSDIGAYVQMGPQSNGRRELAAIVWDAESNSGVLTDGDLCYDRTAGIVGGWVWCPGAYWYQYEINALVVDPVNCGRSHRSGGTVK